MGVNKKRVSLFVMIILAVVYYLVTDPDGPLAIKDLPFGVELVMMLNIFILAGLGITMIEFGPSVFFNGGNADTNEYKLIIMAKEEGSSGELYVGSSIRMLAYAIIVATCINSILS